MRSYSKHCWLPLPFFFFYNNNILMMNHHRLKLKWLAAVRVGLRPQPGQPPVPRSVRLLWLIPSNQAGIIVLELESWSPLWFFFFCIFCGDSWYSWSLSSHHAEMLPIVIGSTRNRYVHQFPPNTDQFTQKDLSTWCETTLFLRLLFLFSSQLRD